MGLHYYDLIRRLIYPERYWFGLILSHCFLISLLVAESTQQRSRWQKVDLTLVSNSWVKPITKIKIEMYSLSSRFLKARSPSECTWRGRRRLPTPGRKNACIPSSFFHLILNNNNNNAINRFNSLISLLQWRFPALVPNVSNASRLGNTLHMALSKDHQHSIQRYSHQ